MVELTLAGGEFGGLWERDPQMRVGYTHKFSGFSIMPEFAIDLPGSVFHQVQPTSQSNSVTASARDRSRNHPDSGTPGWPMAARPRGRNLSAQLIFSGFKGERTANALGSAVPASYQATFP